MRGLGLGLGFGIGSEVVPAQADPFSYAIVKVDPVQGASANTDQSVVIPGASWTPKLAKILMLNKVSGNVQGNSAMTLGFQAVGLSSYIANSLQHADATLATGSCNSSVQINFPTTSGPLKYLRPVNNSSYGVGWIEFVPGGATIHWTTAPGEDFHLIIEFFGGEEFLISAGQTAAFGGGASGSELTVTGLPFQPELLEVVAPNSSSSPVRFTEGYSGDNGSGLVRGGSMFAINTASGFAVPVDCGQLISDQYNIGYAFFNSEQQLYNEVSALTSDGFVITDRTWTTNSVHSYWAANLNGRRVHLGHFDTPTSTGNQVIANLGFIPKCVRIVSTRGTALSYQSSAAESGTFGVCVADANKAYSIGISSEHGANPTNVRAYYHEDKWRYDDPSGNAVVEATFNEFASDFSLNFTTVDSTSRKCLLMAIEE